MQLGQNSQTQPTETSAQIRQIAQAQRPQKRKCLHTTYFGHTAIADSTSRQPVQTPSGKRYVNVMVDVHSKWTWTTLLRSLTQTLEKCTSHVIKQLSPLTKIFRADLGTEFTNSQTKQFLEKLDIRIHFACSDEHQPPKWSCCLNAPYAFFTHVHHDLVTSGGVLVGAQAGLAKDPSLA